MKQAIKVFIVFSVALLFCVTAGFTSDLPNCSSSGYRHNCFATVNFSGDIYKGEFQENKRHGFGTYTFLDGEIYTGDWKNNVRDGFGTNTFKSGEKYIGEYKKDLRDGFGTNYFANGEIYEGYWRNDQQNGLGVVLFSDEYKGDKYIGYHQNNDMHGRGLYVWSDGSADVCFYNKNKASNCSGTNINNVFPTLKRSYTTFNVKDRKIIQQILNEKGKYNDTIDGKWGKNTLIAIAEFAAIEMGTIDLQKTNIVENILTKILQAGLSEEPDPAQNNNTASIASDLPDCPTSGPFDNCFGSYTFDDGDKYVGEFKNDAFNGQGTYTFGPNTEWAGDKYVGEFKNDMTSGQGTYTFANGDKYAGEYKNNKRNGQGTYTHSNGDKYVGEYKNDMMSGQGTYTFANGNKYVGEFDNDSYNGQGTYTFGPNTEWAGDKHVGEYKNNKRNGQGTYTHSNGDKYVGEYKNDMMSGQGTYTFANGNKYVGEFDNDAYNGQGTFTYANGDKYVGELKNNKRNGQGTFTYANGEEWEGFWRDDEFLYADQNTPKEPKKKSIANNIDPDEILNAASGTGFYVSNEGHIITNHHVINGCSEIKVHAEGKSTTATILAKDASNDLALLKIPNRPPHVFAFSNENPYPLQNIIVAGFPFGDAVSSSLKFTTGVISSLAGIGNNYSQMQIDAALQPGNSGGPIIDELGNIVGIAVAKLDVDKVYEDFGVIPENTNFAIKGSIAKILLQSFNVPLKVPNKNEIPKSELSKITTKGTLHLSCWMTLAQIEKMQSQKVLFENFD